MRKTGADRIDFRAYLQEVAASQRIMTPGMHCVVNVEDHALNIDVAVPLGLILSEVMNNAVKHAFVAEKKPELTITFSSEKEMYTLTVRDNGIGFPPNFDLSNPNSLGTELIAALSDQINAETTCFNDSGACFKIEFEDRE